MNADPKGILKWNIGEIARALKISPNNVKEYFTDGRRVSFIIERRLAAEVLKGELAPTEGAGYDIIDSQGDRWEVRSISQNGIYFCPSSMVGSGRHFDKEEFLKKLKEIKGFIIADIESFPEIPFWIISVKELQDWWDNGELDKNTKISRKKALKLLKNLKNESENK